MRCSLGDLEGSNRTPETGTARGTGDGLSLQLSVAQLPAWPSLNLIRLDSSRGQPFLPLMPPSLHRRPLLATRLPDRGPQPEPLGTNDTSAPLPWSGYRPARVLLQLFVRAESFRGKLRAREEPWPAVVTHCWEPGAWAGSPFTAGPYLWQNVAADCCQPI